MQHAMHKRFSPACAGNGGQAHSDLSPLPVQPRVCGERNQSPIASPNAGGSAPRVRGTVSRHPRYHRAARFSPACAGNGQRRQRTVRRVPVQPRVCGERSSATFRGLRPSGSAPRVRGTDRWRQLYRTSHRFSPACAGNGSPGRVFPSSAAVQPRVCGEREIASAESGRAIGSAPRVRGTAEGHRPHIVSQRFSPACAGNGKSTS